MYYCQHDVYTSSSLTPLFVMVCILLTFSFFQSYGTLSNKNLSFVSMLYTNCFVLTNFFNLYTNIRSDGLTACIFFDDFNLIPPELWDIVPWKMIGCIKCVACYLKFAITDFLPCLRVIILLYYVHMAQLFIFYIDLFKNWPTKEYVVLNINLL